MYWKILFLLGYLSDIFSEDLFLLLGGGVGRGLERFWFFIIEVSSVGFVMVVRVVSWFRDIALLVLDFDKLRGSREGMKVLSCEVLSLDICFIFWKICGMVMVVWINFWVSMYVLVCFLGDIWVNLAVISGFNGVMFEEKICFSLV